MSRHWMSAAVLAVLGGLICLTAVGPHAKGGAAMLAGVTKVDFGQTADGTKVDLYTLTNTNGVIAKITTYGGIVTELHVPDKAGKMADVVLGFDNLKGYLG